jgi:hypothetical protein
MDEAFDSVPLVPDDWFETIPPNDTQYERAADAIIAAHTLVQSIDVCEYGVIVQKGPAVTTINLNEEMQELPLIAACVARVNNADYTDLLQRLLNYMTTAEQQEFRRHYMMLEFGPSGRKCLL